MPDFPLPMIIDTPSPNHQPRPGGQEVDMVILHYTGMVSDQEALVRLCDPQAAVSAHYLIREDGTILGLVRENRRAWHAGRACWSRTDTINDRSIGIELVNPGHSHGYRPFPEPQMESLEILLKDILTRHRIMPRHILGHSDIAPTRKCDPGELFDWQRLAASGIGLWPSNMTPDDDAARRPVDRAAFLDKLAAYGYEIPEHNDTAAIIAFERHFRPWKLSGNADAENQQRIDWLLDQVETTQTT